MNEKQQQALSAYLEAYRTFRRAGGYHNQNDVEFTRLNDAAFDALRHCLAVGLHIDLLRDARIALEKDVSYVD